jgi:hypothetical protein
MPTLRRSRDLEIVVSPAGLGCVRHCSFRREVDAGRAWRPDALLQFPAAVVQY